MINDESEKLVAAGTWLYDDAVECQIQIVRRNIAYGSGDYQDPPEIREDREGEFYYLKFSSPGDPEVISSLSGAFEAFEDAKKNANEMCSGLVWQVV